jgi:maltose O-acetyltransferase
MNLFQRLYHVLYTRGRVWHYRTISPARYTGAKPDLRQPVLFKGEGRIHFEGECTFGWLTSPLFYSTYGYVEAREAGSSVYFGKDCFLSNNCAIIASGADIRIGDHCRIGLNCMIVSSDFHHTDPAQRNTPSPPAENITIGNTVFIGNNVQILKGASIGDDSVIGAGSVVTGHIPPRSVAAGVPAKVLKQL